MLQDLLQGFKELVFPDNCVLCKKYLKSSHTQQLCSSCLHSIKRNLPPFCLKCSRHLTSFNEHGLCPSCLKTTCFFDAAYAACLYEKPLIDLIYSFKYHGKTSLKKTFSRLMIEYIDTYHIPINNFDMIVPMALHPTKLRERGFNQAQILSQIIASRYSLPHKTDILNRSKYTQPQALQEAKQRWTNVHEAFKITSFTQVADKSILIVDDLITTTATANAAAQALKNSGAAYVGLLTLSITP